MSSQDDDIPDDKLLTLPGEAISGSDAPSLRAKRANLQHERDFEEFNREMAGDAPPRMLFPWTDPREAKRLEEKHRHEQLQIEQEMREIAERQNRLLLQLDEELAEIEERRKEIEDNAIRLRDGRRVYVDGDRFRDEQGRVLTGADEAEATHQHEYRPDASTWVDKQENERREEEAQKLKRKVLKEKESAEGTPEQQSAQLDSNEKAFAEEVHARQSAMSAVQATSRTASAIPDYGDGDYMAEYQLSSAPAFNEASGIAKAVPDKEPKDDDGEAVRQELKQPTQSFGHAAPKP
jgi:hypothetical protein